MRKLNCFVIDDERHACELLQHYIEQDDRLSFIGMHHSVSHFDSDQYPIDVLFLDIEMPGMAGIDFLRSTDPLFKTVLTTAYADYAIDGFELGVVDYLLKPILNKRFTLAIDKIVKLFETAHKSVQLDELEARQNTIVLKSGTKRIKLVPERILYIVAQNEYVSIVTDTERHTIYIRMKDIAEDPGFSKLLRVHRSYFINPIHISELSNEYVKIEKDIIPIGRSYKKMVKDVLM